LKNHLFHPSKIKIPHQLIIIPYFWNRDYFVALKDSALKKIDLLNSELIIFKDYALLTGFLGYPHLLTLLEFIRDVSQKEIYFLGTAGCLISQIDKPEILNVTKIYPSSIYSLFSKEKCYGLPRFPKGNFRPVSGVSVDLIQRETCSWLKKQRIRGVDIVEMEIFPLRVFLSKPFYCLVVATDQVTPDGIIVFKDKKLFKSEFKTAFGFIVDSLK